MALRIVESVEALLYVCGSVVCCLLSVLPSFVLAGGKSPPPLLSLVSCLFSKFKFQNFNFPERTVEKRRELAPVDTGQRREEKRREEVGNAKQSTLHNTTMSWDDEDFDIPASAAPAAASASWEDGALDDIDDPVLESWDIDSDEEREKEKKKKDELAAKKAEQKAKLEAKKNGGKKGKTLLEIDLVDEKTRREMLKQQELNADLNNAADLFDGLGVADHPRARATAAANAAAAGALKLTADTPLKAHPLFNPESKQDFEKLRKTLGATLKELSTKSTLFYANSLAIDLARDTCEPLSVEQIRKVISTLNAIVAQKIKEERQNRLKKTGGTSLGGAGKKKAKTATVNTGPASFKKDNLEEFMGGDDDGLSDDDFM